MNNYILIIPYFGKLPSYFGAFLHSCSRLDQSGNIMIITDDDAINSYDIPPVVITRRMSFRQMQDLVKERLGGILPTGYKLCDYKPAYGELFKEEIRNYKYWGYCDCDTLIGDIPSFLDRINYSQYDRIGDKGHFTIYRNDEKINRLYLYKLNKNNPTSNFQYVRKTSYPCNFDECGMNIICQEAGLKFYNHNHVLAVEDHHSLHFHTYDTVYSGNVYPQLFVWDKGKVFLYEKKNGTIEKKEYMYIHYEGRKKLEVLSNLGDMIAVSHLGFHNIQEKDIPSLLQDIGRPDTEDERKQYEREDFVNSRRGNLKKLQQEFKSCGLSAIPNIARRIQSVLNSRFGK